MESETETTTVHTDTTTTTARRTNGGDGPPVAVEAGDSRGRRPRGRLSLEAEFAICADLASGYEDADVVKRAPRALGITRERVARFRRERADEIAAMREQLRQQARQAGIAVPEERLRRLNRIAGQLERRINKGDHRECALLMARYLELFKIVARESGAADGKSMKAEVSDVEVSQERREYADKDERYRAAFRTLARAAAEIGGLGGAS
jgi:hypothetical protein